LETRKGEGGKQTERKTVGQRKKEPSKPGTQAVTAKEGDGN